MKTHWSPELNKRNVTLQWKAKKELSFLKVNQGSLYEIRKPFFISLSLDIECTFEKKFKVCVLQIVHNALSSTTVAVLLTPV